MTSSPFKKAVGVFSAAVAILPIAGTFAADVSWDNPGTGLFMTGSNWDTDTVPTAADDAYIMNGGTAEIQTGDVVEVSRLLIEDGTVTQTGGSVLTVPFGNFESPGAYEIGGFAGMIGNYNISGSSALTGGRVRIGYAGGEGHVTIGGTSTYDGANNQDTWVGNGSGSVGSLTMTDTAKWTVTNDWVVVGRSGATGTLTMSGDTTLAVVTGGNMVLGDGGTATVNLSGAAKVSAQNQVWVGNGGGAHTELTMSGTASLTSDDDWLVIGRNGGTGIVTMNGGTLERKGPSGGRQMIVADGGGANGTLTVNAGAVISNSELWIGQNGTGTLTLNDGTVTVGSWVAVGRDGASSGTLNINGGTFDKNGNGNFIVNGQAGFVNQTGGALNVNSGETWLSEATGKTSTWVASGGTASLGPITRIGFGGDATMTISGTANYTNQTVYIGSNVTSTGTLNLNGGTFTANFIEEGAGNGFINFDGGVLRAGAASTSFLPDFEVADIDVKAGGLKFDTNSHAVTITNALQGAGGLTKQGAGTLTMSGLNSFAGASAVEAGTLVIATTGALDAVESLSVASGAALELENAVSLNDEIILSLASGSTLVLDFEGTETIGALWLGDEGFLAVDTYTVAELEALGSGVLFTGSDPDAILNVTSAVPEPTTVALLAGGMAMIFWRLRRRNQA